MPNSDSRSLRLGCGSVNTPRKTSNCLCLWVSGAHSEFVSKLGSFERRHKQPFCPPLPLLPPSAVALSLEACVFNDTVSAENISLPSPHPPTPSRATDIYRLVNLAREPGRRTQLGVGGAHCIETGAWLLIMTSHTLPLCCNPTPRP